MGFHVVWLCLVWLILCVWQTARVQRNDEFRGSLWFFRISSRLFGNKRIDRCVCVCVLHISLGFTDVALWELFNSIKYSYTPQTLIIIHLLTKVKTKKQQSRDRSLEQASVYDNNSKKLGDRRGQCPPQHREVTSAFHCCFVNMFHGHLKVDFPHKSFPQLSVAAAHGNYSERFKPVLSLAWLERH